MSKHRREVDAVIDVGKSNVRVCAIDQSGRAVRTESRANRVLAAPPYPHFDVDGLFAWTLAALRTIGDELYVRTIIPVAHGACAALVDDGELLLPILDYEFDSFGDMDDYDAIARDFANTASPRLPAGLNLGRQLYWLSRRYPREFAKATILPYPQYWAWKFAGVHSCEVTSLGCHTDLWEPCADRFSKLAIGEKWVSKFARRVDSWTSVGPATAEARAAAGLSDSCVVLAGIHDSNASYLAYRASRNDRFCVVSSGTWIVMMSHGASLDGLREELDTLANVDALGQPVATARFMGGREYEAVAGANGLRARPTASDLKQILDAQTLALPAFSDQGGPFRQCAGRIDGQAPANPAQAAALAALYCALMTDLCLEFIDSRGDIVVDGPLAGNEAFTSAFASLRPAQRVLRSVDESGALRGAAVLSNWSRGEEPPSPPLEVCGAAEVARLDETRVRWRRLLPKE